MVIHNAGRFRKRHYPNRYQSNTSSTVPYDEELQNDGHLFAVLRTDASFVVVVRLRSGIMRIRQIL